MADQQLDPVSWSPWQLDHHTAGWALWLAFFVVWETYGVATGYAGTLTAHLRPIFASWPVTWWITFGLWCWIGLHFLAPAVEHALLDLLTAPRPQ